MAVGLSAMLNNPEFRDRFSNRNTSGGKLRAQQDFALGGSGVAKPGQELQIRGLNDFVQQTNRFRDVNSSFLGTADQVGLSGAVQTARGQATRIADVEAGAVNRRLATQDLSERQRRAVTRRIGLGRAVAEASAGSAVRRNFSETARLASKQAGDIEQGLRDIQVEGLTQLSNAAGQEQIRRDAKEADKKEARSGLIGSVIGAGLALFSSEDYKHDKQETGSLLDRMKNIRVEKWKYRGDDVTNHIGPYAGEFNEAFGVGQDDPDKINIGDSLGVLIGAVKELNEKVEANAS